jgi:hypothetical protein
MWKQLRVMTGSLVGAGGVALAVCLGAQNLSDRPSLQLGNARSAPLPSGFLIGMALAAGVFSGGSVAALAFNAANKEEPEAY